MDSLPAASLLELGRAARGEKRYTDAGELFRDALEACGPDDSDQLRAAIQVEIGRVARDLRDNESAISHYSAAAEIYRGLNDRMNLAHAVRHVADILRGMGRTDAAEPYISEAIVIYRAQEPLPELHLANALRVLALLKEQTGNNAEALPLWVEARDRYRAVGVDAGVAESRAHLAAAESA